MNENDLDVADLGDLEALLNSLNEDELESTDVTPEQMEEQEVAVTSEDTETTATSEYTEAISTPENIEATATPEDTDTPEFTEPTDISSELEGLNLDDNAPISDADLDAILSELGADAAEPSVIVDEEPADSANKNEDSENIAASRVIAEETNSEDILKQAQEQAEKEKQAAEALMLSGGTIRPRNDSSPKKQKSSGKLANGRTAGTLVASILLIAALGVGTVWFLNNRDYYDESVNMGTEYEPSIVVSQGSIGGALDSNFIFVSENRGTGDRNFFLSRMLLDSQYTVFYFEDSINWDDYIVDLVDNQGRVYHYAILGNLGSQITNRLAFQPVHTDTRGLVLTITSRDTGSTATFPIEFDGSMARLPVFYKNIRTQKDLGDSVLTITGGSFASSGTNIFYTIEHGDTGFDFDNVTLVSGVRISTLRNHVAYYVGNGTILGRLEFDPVSNVSGNINLVFGNAFMRYNNSQAIDITSLLTNNVLNRIEIPFGDSNLVLERLGRRSNDFLLIMHSTDENGERQHTRINATLQVIDTLGNNAFLDGTIMSGPIGADMSFDITQQIGPVSTVILHLDNIQSGGDDLTVSIDMDLLETSLNFADAVPLNESVNQLHAMGYQLVELVTYSIHDHEMIAVYIVYLDGLVSLYQANAIRQDNGVWSHTISQLTN